MSKQNTLVLRAPSAQSSGEKMTNAGVGFVDSVTLTSGEKRSVVHFLPEQPLVKGKTVMVFRAVVMSYRLKSPVMLRLATGIQAMSCTIKTFQLVQHGFTREREPSSWLSRSTRTLVNKQGTITG